MKHRLLYALLLTMNVFAVSAQEQDNDAISRKLIKATPIQLLSTTDVMCGSNFVYLGQVKTSKGEQYYVSSYYIKLTEACVQTSRVLLYDKAFTYLGNYAYQSEVLPASLENNVLTGENFVAADFSNGMPEKLQINAVLDDEQHVRIPATTATFTKAEVKK